MLCNAALIFQQPSFHSHGETQLAYISSVWSYIPPELVIGHRPRNTTLPRDVAVLGIGDAASRSIMVI